MFWDRGNPERSSLILLCPVQPALAWTTFRVGLYCGVFIVLAISFILTGSHKIEHLHSKIFPALCMFGNLVDIISSTQYCMCRWLICAYVTFNPTRCCVDPLREHLASGEDLPGWFPADPVPLPVGHQHLRMETGRSQPCAHLRDQPQKQPLTPTPVWGQKTISEIKKQNFVYWVIMHF